jgi:hypothetical protein
MDNEKRWITNDGRWMDDWKTFLCLTTASERSSDASGSAFEFGVLMAFLRSMDFPIFLFVIALHWRRLAGAWDDDAAARA